MEDLEEVIIGICEKSANRAKLKSKWSGKKSNDPTLRNGFKEYNEEPKPGFTLEYLDDKSAERGGAYEQSFSATMNGLKEALKVSDELAKKENASRVKLRPSYMLDLLQNEYVKPLYYYSEDEE